MTETEWLTSEDPRAMLERLKCSDLWTSMNPPKGPIGGRKLRLFACACVRLDGVAPHVVDRLERNGTDAFDSDVSWASAVASANRDLPIRQRQAVLLREIVGNPWRSVGKPRMETRCERCDGEGTPGHGIDCPACKGHGFVTGHCPWLIPQVLSIAQACYEERPGRACKKCNGVGEYTWSSEDGGSPWMHCPDCQDTGRVQDGSLDPVRLAILADALEEAGCVGTKEDPCRPCGGHGTEMQAGPDRGPAPKCSYCGGKRWRDWPNPIVEHLRSPGPHVRGCWVLDLLLGKE